MNKKRILLATQTIASIIMIIAIIGLTINMLKGKRNDLDESNIKSSMLLIQGACKVLYEDSVMKKTTDSLIGTKISDADNADYINKEIINKFKETNTIAEGDYEKYYILTDTDLEEINVYVRNEADSYYIICYEKDELIITKGYNGKYKLSEITDDETAENGNDEKNNNESTSEEKSNDDNSSEEKDNSKEEEKTDENEESETEAEQ